MSTLGKLPYAATDPRASTGMPGKGDAVVVCRADGTTNFFLLDVDHRGLLEKAASGATMSDEEFGQLDAAHRAMVLFFVAQNEQLLETLTGIMNDPDFLGSEPIPNLS